MKAYLEIRSQNAKGTWPRRGPDTYVSVQIVPAGVIRLKQLNRKIAKNRGIILVYCGEGYYNRRNTNKSMLGKALQKAERIVQALNA